MSRLAVFLLSLAACAASQETHGPTAGPASTTPAAAAAPEDDQVCHEEVPTGSHVGRTVCRSRSQIDRERQEGQEFQRKGYIQPQKPRPD